MRRTQIINRTLQFGLPDLVLKSGVYSPNVALVRSVEDGDEYDEYMISWK